MTTPARNSANALCEAFADFENASQKLSAFYQDLESRVGTLAEELASSRAGQARELREKERLAARLESLLEALPGGVVVLDGQGRVQEFNPVACDLLGALTAGEAWSAVVGRAFSPRWDDGHDISLTDGRRVNLATQALGGEPGQILLLKDVTETRRLQDQLAHHKRISAKTEMAAAMAHQIRTPLAAALLNVGNLRRLAADPDSGPRAVERALKSLRKLERLVDEMLLFARGRNLEVRRIHAGELLSGIETAAREAFSFSEFAVVCSVGAGDGDVWANTDALTSIALNLIDNAFHACGGRGAIHISTRVRDGMYEFVFEDEGPGVAADSREKAFEPFHSTRANGTGLGLSVARAVALAHSGDLRLEDGARTGACFVLALPLIDGARSRVTDSSAGHAGQVAPAFGQTLTG